MNSTLMVKLIKSEFILNKKTLLTNGLMFSAMIIIYPLIIPEVGTVFAMMGILLGMYPAILLARQSKFKADDTICTLPITRRQLILGKYAFMGLSIIVGFLFFMILLLILPYIQFAKSELFNADILVNVLFAVSLICGLLTPLIVQFGFMGVMYFVLGLNMFTVVVFILTSLGLIPNALDFFFRDLPQAFRNLRLSLGAPGYHLLTIGIAICVGFLSLKLSQRLYERKEF